MLTVSAALLGMLALSNAQESSSTSMPTSAPAPVTICSYANNTLGTCECGQQLFVSEDCKTGFYCMDSGFPEGVVADGCIKTCRDDEILIVDPANYEWECVPLVVNDMYARICPGKFNIECPGNGEIGACECDGQLWINEDCSEGFYCNSVNEGGGEDITCGVGERVDVDLTDLSWKCVPEDDNCPGALHVGCDATYSVPDKCVDESSSWATCECHGQISINNDCTEGYFCHDSSSGCSTKCAENEILIIDPRTPEYWSCQQRTPEWEDICPGYVKTECDCGQDFCDFDCNSCPRQAYISKDCSKARRCIRLGMNPWQELDCPPGEIVDINIHNYEWKCIEDDGRCLDRHFDIGCNPFVPSTASPPPTTTTSGSAITICSYANNTLGTCECGQQLFINSDCSEGFYCMDSGFPDGVVADGCIKTCRDDEILVVDPASYEWECIPKVVNNMYANLCPGEFNIECPGNGEIGACECDGQLWINEDCSEGFYCNSVNEEGGEDIMCGEGERVDVDLTDLSWECVPDDGKCLGAFHVGCATESPPPTTTTPGSAITICSYANNTLGTCECGQQLFINSDCSEGFYCMDSGFPDGVVADGCIKTCRAEEILVVDPANYEWECIPKVVNNMYANLCPGEFNIECPGNGEIGACECDGQLWINEDCSEGFYCNSVNEEGGEDITCGEGERVDVDLTDLSWECVPDDGNCLGAFHVGCATESPSTPTMGPAETTTSGDHRTQPTLLISITLILSTLITV